jgi:hypothetical protein
MTEAGSNISEWPICEKRETQSKERGKKKIWNKENECRKGRKARDERKLKNKEEKCTGKAKRRKQ